MILRFIHVAYINSFISFYCLVLLCCIGISLFIHSPIDGHLGCVQFLVIRNRAFMTCVLQGLVCVQMLLFLLSKCPGMECVCVCVCRPPHSSFPNTVYLTEPGDGEKVCESLGCQA